MAASFAKWIGWIVFPSLLLVYLLFPTQNNYWDGIYFAWVIENAPGLDATLIQPNHPVYSPFGYIFYRLLRTFDAGVRAVHVLQILNCFLSVAAAGVLYLVLKRTFGRPGLAYTLTVLFALSATWWKFSTDADSYVASILFLIAAFYLILPQNKPRLVATALLHAIAMCFHQLAVFFFPVAVLGIYFQTSQLSSKARVRALAAYSLISFILTFGTYYHCFYLQKGTLNLIELFRWMTYYSPENGFTFKVQDSLTHTLRGNLKLFFEGRFNFISEILNPATAILLLLLTTLLGVLFFQVYKLIKSRGSAPHLPDNELRRVTILALTWVAVYLVWLFFWIPKNTFYRMFYMPAIVVLIGVAVTRYRLPERSRLLLPSFVAVMALANFLFFIYPYSRVRPETPLALAQQMNSVWSQNSTVYFSSVESDNLLLRYFNPSSTWKLAPKLDTCKLEHEVKQIHSTGGNVWLETTLAKKAAAKPETAKWLADHTIAEKNLVNRNYDIRLIQLDPKPSISTLCP